MERYEAYKDSGVDWIGAIPTGWGVKKIKHLCYVKGRVGWKGLKSSEFLLEGFSYLVTGTDFKDRKVNWKDCYHIDKSRYEEDPYIQLQVSDLLITKDGTIGKLAIIDELDKPACLNSGIFVVRSVNKDFSTRYLYWVLTSNIFTNFNKYTSYGSTIQHLYQNIFIEFSFGFPTVGEQTDIANFLDRKTAEIDALITQKERLLELYEEEKTAIINHAVTKGLDPNAELKDSGIDWLGEIPIGWEVKKLKHTANLKSGDNLTSNQIKEDGAYPVYGGNGLRGYYNGFTHDGDFILIGRQGAHCGNINYGSNKFWATEHAVVVEPLSDYKTVWMGEVLRVMNLNQYSVAAAQPGLSVEAICNLSIPWPLLEEQASIVESIEAETARINSKITKTQRIIELQKEYRTALISEMVTGKIKVPELPTQEASA